MFLSNLKRPWYSFPSHGSGQRLVLLSSVLLWFGLRFSTSFLASGPSPPFAEVKILPLHSALQS